MAHGAERRRRPLILLAAIVALGCALRLWRIDAQSAWAPEILSVYVAGLSFRDIIHWLIVDHKHYLDAPLYYLLLHSWFAAFGPGVLQARLLALCFGVLTIPVTYLLAKLLVEKRAALVATLILTISQAGVVYSQEARQYSQLMFFTAATSYLFLRALRERRTSLWWLASFAAVALVFTHFYGMFAIAALAGFAFWQRKQYAVRWTWWAAAALVLAAPVAVWLALIWDQYPITTDMLLTPEPAMFDVRVGWRELPGSLVWLNGSRWYGIGWSVLLALTALGGLVFTLPAAIGAVRLHRESAVLLTALCAVPVLGIVALGSLGFNKYLDFAYHLQNVVLCAVPYYILVAAGIAALRTRWLRAAAVALLVLFNAVVVGAAYFIPAKADYRAGLAAIAEGYREGDCCLFYPLVNQHLLVGHRSGPPQYWHAYQPDQTGVRLVSLEDALRASTGCRRFWFFWDHTSWLDRTGKSREAKQALDQALVKLDERKYFLTEVSLYTQRAVR